jgi:hypothetical protein
MTLIAAFGVFLLWGAAMATLVGSTLVVKGTMLDHIWSLNPRAYNQLAALGAGIPLLLVAVALTSASVGWFNRRRWAWSLAVAIIVTQIAGDWVQPLPRMCD